MPTHRQRAVRPVAVQVHKPGRGKLRVQQRDQVQRGGGPLHHDRPSEQLAEIAEQLLVLRGGGPPRPARHLGGELVEQPVGVGSQHRQDVVADQRNPGVRAEPAVVWVQHLRGAQSVGDHRVQHRKRAGQQPPQLCAVHVAGGEPRWPGRGRDPQGAEELAHRQHAGMLTQQARQQGGTAPAGPHDEGELHSDPRPRSSAYGCSPYRRGLRLACRVRPGPFGQRGDHRGREHGFVAGSA